MNGILYLSLLVIGLLSSNGIVRSDTLPILDPWISTNRNEGNHRKLALALQQEKYHFGAIGCTFSDSVCDLSLEYCFNDHAFGRCVAAYGIPTKEDSYRYNLRREDVHLLEEAMEGLFEKGFRWSHSYTQCFLQNLLKAIRTSEPLGRLDCIEDNLDDEVKDQQTPQQSELAFLKLSPDAVNEDSVDDIRPVEEIKPIQLPSPSLPKNQPIGKKYPSREEQEANLENAVATLFLEDYLDEVDSKPEWAERPNTVIGEENNEIRHSEYPIIRKIFNSDYKRPERLGGVDMAGDDLEFLHESPLLTSDLGAEPYSDLSSVPVELTDEEAEEVVKLMSEIEKEAEKEAREETAAQEVEAVLGNRNSGKLLDNQGTYLDLPSQDSVYTEGGLVFLNNPKRFLYERSNDGDPADEEFELDLRPDLRPSGFERRERLDVKKPGPWSNVNNYAFNKHGERELEQQLTRNLNPEFGGIGPADMQTLDTAADHQLDHREIHEEIRRPEIIEQKVAKPIPGEEIKEFVDLIKKASSSAEASKLADKVPGNQLEIIDTSYVSLQLRNKIGSWNEARGLVNLLADFLDLKHSVFREVRLQDKTIITFKVGSNDKGLIATDVAGRIESLKGDVERESGLVIDRVAAGVKANTELPASEPLILDGEIHNKGLYVATFAICGIVAATLVAAFFIFIIRKTAKSREKFSKLGHDDPAMESCKDYQELCRARMASKSNEKVEPIRAVQRVQSNVSRDSEGGTSSSRSSTSSWSEEPVLTNMDISTGHMVLSYMEDHLKKKDRLDEEWAALCTYEADPGSTTIAEKVENTKKNRYSNSLPYDHSRVILNDLANVSGADYINASTITDHDPRNPAYIATQGPLPVTAADFWQMVWEQGSVVIVTLTKLAENGTTLCHRYWPEEGSELHHIYEVHLVSEHIWCDEYLVRSFYLKNLKTGETRTVTQFHFLAWTENGIPTSAKSLLEFRRKVNKSYRGRSCPIIVHCSDGAGRTGTYCLIDMVLNRMTKGAKEIDIAASLEHIRDQRPGMVRTKQQFEFVLMAVAEEVHAILKALPQ